MNIKEFIAAVEVAAIIVVLMWLVFQFGKIKEKYKIARQKKEEEENNSIDEWTSKRIRSPEEKKEEKMHDIIENVFLRSEKIRKDQKKERSRKEDKTKEILRQKTYLNEIIFHRWKKRGEYTTNLPVIMMSGAEKIMIRISGEGSQELPNDVSIAQNINGLGEAVSFSLVDLKDSELRTINKWIEDNYS